MNLPAADEAIIPPEKLRDYVLSPDHHVGRFKAAFFAKLGYTQAGWRRLEADLRAQHVGLPAEMLERTDFGTKYRIDGLLGGPNGRSAEIVAIWIVRTGETQPCLVTLVPGAFT